MKVTAKLKNTRTSPRKVRLVANFIKDMEVATAIVQLGRTVKKTAPEIEKLLKSAVANAENNFGLDRDNLFVQEVLVGEGPRLKRWLPRAQGRATQILKRTSNIQITLEERIEGKNKKSKQELEALRKQREQEREKMIKELEKQQKLEEKAAAESVESPEKTPAAIKPERSAPKKGESKKGQDKGFLKKVFNRKSV